MSLRVYSGFTSVLLRSHIGVTWLLFRCQFDFISLRCNFDVSSKPLSFQCDITSVPVRVPFDTTSIPLRIRFGFISKSPLNVTSMSFISHFVFDSITFRCHLYVIVGPPRFHFNFASTSLRSQFEGSSMSLRYRFGFSQISFRFHFDFTSM